MAIVVWSSSEVVVTFACLRRQDDDRRAGSRTVERRGSPELGPSWLAGKLRRARSTTINPARTAHPTLSSGWWPVCEAGVFGRLLLLKEPTVGVARNGPYASVDGGFTRAGQLVLQSNTASWC